LVYWNVVPRSTKVYETVFTLSEWGWMFHQLGTVNKKRHWEWYFAYLGWKRESPLTYRPQASGGMYMREWRYGAEPMAILGKHRCLEFVASRNVKPVQEINEGVTLRQDVSLRFK